jgi:hypothetical protein
MSRIGATVGYVAVVVGLVAGCSASTVEPVGVTSAATVAPTATPAPTPTPTVAATGVVLVLSDPALGIVFEAAPALEGDAADVYNWLATYEKEYWRTLTTNVTSPAFSVIASTELTALMERIAASNANDQSRVGGVFHVSISGISVDGDVAHGTTCDSCRDVTFADAKGSQTLEENGVSQPRLLEATLARGDVDGQWIIHTQTRIGTC